MPVVLSRGRLQINTLRAAPAALSPMILTWSSDRCAPQRRSARGYSVPPCAADADPSQFSAFSSLQRGVRNVDCAWPNGCPVCFRQLHVLVTADWRAEIVFVHWDTLNPTAPRPGTLVPYSRSSVLELSTRTRIY
jgi:hypothetical protein